MTQHVTPYAQHVATKLSMMGDFESAIMWSQSPSNCTLTGRLRDADRASAHFVVPSRVKAEPLKTVSSVRIAPLLALVLVCIWLCPWEAFRQVDVGAEQEVHQSSAMLQAEKMAECQYGCTGSSTYEYCVVGCAEVISEESCSTSIACTDCSLVFAAGSENLQDCASRCVD